MGLLSVYCILNFPIISLVTVPWKLHCILIIASVVTLYIGSNPFVITRFYSISDVSWPAAISLLTISRSHLAYSTIFSPFSNKRFCKSANVTSIDATDTFMKIFASATHTLAEQRNLLILDFHDALVEMKIYTESKFSFYTSSSFTCSLYWAPTCFTNCHNSLPCRITFTSFNHFDMKRKQLHIFHVLPTEILSNLKTNSNC